VFSVYSRLCSLIASTLLWQPAVPASSWKCLSTTCSCAVQVRTAGQGDSARRPSSSACRFLPRSAPAITRAAKLAADEVRFARQENIGTVTYGERRTPEHGRVIQTKGRVQSGRHNCFPVIRRSTHSSEGHPKVKVHPVMSIWFEKFTRNRMVELLSVCLHAEEALL